VLRGRVSSVASLLPVSRRRSRSPKLEATGSGKLEAGS
jgi:hypothetical protein